MKVLFSLALVDYTRLLKQVFFKSSYNDRDNNSTIHYSWWFVPPKMTPSSVKTSSKYLPKRELLLFMTVCAFPNASNRGLTFRSIHFVNSNKCLCATQNLFYFQIQFFLDTRCQGQQMLNDKLAGLCLAGTRFTGDDATLGTLAIHHIMINIISYCVNVWRNFLFLLCVALVNSWHLSSSISNMMLTFMCCFLQN